MLIMQKNSFRKTDRVTNIGFAASALLIPAVFILLPLLFVELGLTKLHALVYVLLPSLLIIPALCLTLYYAGKPGGLRQKFKLINFHPRQLLLSCAGAVLLLLVMGDFISLYHRILNGFGIRLQKPPIEAILRESGGWTLAAVCAGIIILAPFTEELVFRRFVFGFLAPRCGFTAALLLTALVFALIHFSLYSFPALFILGIAFQLIYLKFGSLYPAIFMHAFNNAIATAVILYLPQLN
ncbi:MAG: type II CAAX endopeptidase family protein [Victivallales bacterium]|nr:type II CAAX endopeptidase family protein [Victivallales bacterium]